MSGGRFGGGPFLTFYLLINKSRKIARKTAQNFHFFHIQPILSEDPDALTIALFLQFHDFVKRTRIARIHLFIHLTIYSPRPLERLRARRAKLGNEELGVKLGKVWRRHKSTFVTSCKSKRYKSIGFALQKHSFCTLKA